jgi:hypothetical protein
MYYAAEGSTKGRTAARPRVVDAVRRNKRHAMHVVHAWRKVMVISEVRHAGTIIYHCYV